MKITYPRKQKDAAAKTHDYIILYRTWGELEEKTWGELEGRTWDEILGGEL